MPRLLSLQAVALALCLATSACGKSGGAGQGGNNPPVPPSGNTFHLTVVVTGNGSVVPIGGDFAKGATVALHATPELTYHVGGWVGTVDDSSLSTDNSVVMDSDKTVEVLFLFKTAQ